MANKTGWGQAKLGKTLKSTDNLDGQYGEYKGSNVKSSRDLNGLYDQYQGKKLGSKKS